jgi:hypothetical protein
MFWRERAFMGGAVPRMLLGALSAGLTSAHARAVSAAGCSWLAAEFWRELLRGQPRLCRFAWLLRVTR